MSVDQRFIVSCFNTLCHLNENKLNYGYIVYKYCLFVIINYIRRWTFQPEISTSYDKLLIFKW